MATAPSFSINALSLTGRLPVDRLMLVGDGGQVVRAAYAALQAGGLPEMSAFTVISGPGIYTATDGHSYLIPSARLAMRQNLAGVPDVFFDQTEGGGWVLQAAIELVRPAGSPDAALMPLTDFHVAIDPGNGSAPFAFATAVPAPADGRAAEVALVIRAEGPVDANQGLMLLRQNPRAAFVVTATVQFQVPAPPRPHPGPHPGPGPGPHPVMEVGTPPGVHPPGEPGHPGPGFTRPILPDIARIAALAQPASVPIRSFRLADRTLIDPALIVPHTAGDASDDAPRDVPRSASVTLTADPKQNGACFPSDLPANRPIYALILGDTAGAGAVWTRETGASWTRAAAGLNRYDVLPDGFALALDHDTGLPAMSVVLVQNPPASPGGPNVYTVRVRFGVAPQLDDARLDAVRAALRSAHAVPYATLAVGDYGSATFTPSGLFANLPGFQSSTGGGDAAAGSRPVDASGGFELVIDCSLEFYTLLTGVLKSPEGLRGSVRFELVTGRSASVPPADQTTLVDVPVRLGLTGDMEVDLGTRVAGPPPPAGADSLPVEVSNPLDVVVTVGAVLPTFLLMDKRPDLASLATPGAAVPPGVTLPAKGTAIVTVSGPGGGPLPPYTALVTGFARIRPAFDADALLNRVHAQASATGASTSVHVSCYLLHHADQIPASLAGLIGLKVQVQRTGGSVLDVPLTLDKPDADLALPYSLADLLAGASLDQPSFTYRVCVLFADRIGPWTDWLPNTGRDLLVTPATA